jgi:glycosyltransferase involved in cell wall biosynthesis
VYNEARTVAEVLRRVHGVPLSLGYEKEIIVVDDGSTDDTPFIVESVAREISLRLFTHECNRGKGVAIRTALAEARGEVVLIQDADLEYDPREYGILLAALSAETAAVYGARGTKRYPKRGFHFVLGARFLTGLVNFLFGVHLTDSYTGYKLFRTEVLRSLALSATGFEFEAEVTCKLLAGGARIVEVPLAHYMPRSVAEGKKIGWRDAWRGFLTILWVWYNNKEWLSLIKTR